MCVGNSKCKDPEAAAGLLCPEEAPRPLWRDQSEPGVVRGGENRKVIGHILQDCVGLLLRTFTFPRSEVKAMNGAEYRTDMISFEL